MTVRFQYFLVVSMALGGSAGCSAADPMSAPVRDPVAGPVFTLGSGLTPTPAVRGNLGDLKYKTIYDGFHFEFQSHGNTDVVTVSVTGGPGSHSGWHYHPGPSIVIVRRGTLTSYSVDGGECRRTEYPAGTALVEGTSPHRVVNEGTIDIELSVVFFTPAGAAQRIDSPDPGLC